MKKLILAFSLFAILPMFSIAQNSKQAPKTENKADNVDPVQYAERLSKELQRAVKLNEEQYRQVFDLNMRTFNDLREAKNNDDNNGRMATVRKEKEEELKRILTPEQYKQMLEWKKNKKEDAAVDYNQRMTEKKAEKAKAKTSK